MKNQPTYKKPFSEFVKRQHRPFQAVIEDHVGVVCNCPDIGELKVGDLAGISVYKFKYQRQEYLIAYHTHAPLGCDSDCERKPGPLFLVVDFYRIGTHENFYGALKGYLKATGWYK